MNTSWSGDRRGFPDRIRAAILARDPICVICGDNPSTIADHEPSYAELRRMGVSDPHSIEYGQGVCDQCHEVKTRAEQQRGRDRWRLKPEAHPGLA